MVTFEERIKKKIPNNIQKKDIAYGYLVSFIRTNNITSLKQLRNSLKLEIDAGEIFIRNNRSSPTNNRVIREYSRKVSHFKKIKSLMDAYL